MAYRPVGLNTPTGPLPRIRCTVWWRSRLTGPVGWLKIEQASGAPSASGIAPFREEHNGQTNDEDMQCTPASGRYVVPIRRRDQSYRRTAYLKHSRLFFELALLLFSWAGPLPEALGALTNLTALHLSNTQLSGKPGTLARVRLFVLVRHLDLVVARWRVDLSNSACQLQKSRA